MHRDRKTAYYLPIRKSFKILQTGVKIILEGILLCRLSSPSTDYCHIGYMSVSCPDKPISMAREMFLKDFGSDSQLVQIL